MSRIFGSYELKSFANKGKLEKIKSVLIEYRKTAQNISKFLWKEFFKNGQLPHKKKVSIKNISSNLSERYKYVCLWQVVSTLESFLSNLQNKFANIVYSSNLDKEDKLILLALNNQRAWLRYDKEEVQIYDGKETKTVKVKDLPARQACQRQRGRQAAHQKAWQVLRVAFLFPVFGRSLSRDLSPLPPLLVEGAWNRVRSRLADLEVGGTSQ